MNAKLREILKRAESWPEAVQDEAAATLQQIEDEHLGRFPLTPEDRQALERSADDARAGRFARDEDVERILGRRKPA